MEQQLAKLANIMNNLKLSTEANLILKLAEPNITELWEQVLHECQSPLAPHILNKAVSYMVSGTKSLAMYAIKLQFLSPEQIQQAVELGLKFPGVSTASGIDFDKIKKYANDLNAIFPNQEFSHFKVAQVMNSMSGAGSEIAQQSTFKLVPYIGVIFSAMFAVKSLLYGLIEFSRLMESAPTLGLEWYETLFPEKLESKIQEFNDQPEKLTLLCYITKVSREFITQGIGLIADSTDMVKDLIMVFVNLASLGLSIFLDLGSSLLIAIIQYFVTSSVTKDHNNLIANIFELADKKLNEARLGFSEIDFSQLSDEDLFSYYA